MILYNVTIKIDHEVQADWLAWMKAVHIPDVMNTGLFLEYRICRMLSDEPDGITYAVQYFCQDLETLLEYQQNFARNLQADVAKRYPDKYVAFRTVMEVVG